MVEKKKKSTDKLTKAFKNIDKCIMDDLTKSTIEKILEYKLRNITIDTHSDIINSLASVVGVNEAEVIDFFILNHKNIDSVLKKYEGKGLTKNTKSFLIRLASVYGYEFSKAFARSNSPQKIYRSSMGYDSETKHFYSDITKGNFERINVIFSPNDWAVFLSSMSEKLSQASLDILKDIEPDTVKKLKEEFTKVRRKLNKAKKK